MLYFGASQIGTYLSPLFNYSHYIPAIVGDFAEESPAKKAGIKKGDRIVNINGVHIDNWESVGETIQLFDGTLYFHIIRDNMKMGIDIEPILRKQKNQFGESIDRKLIGIAPDAPNELIFSPLEGLAFAWNETLHASTLIFTSIKKLLVGDVSADQLGGVVTIVDITAKASQSGIIALLFFTALISVNLGVLNLLPIPALDGGHIGFNLYEMITGKMASEEVMYKLTLIGWGLLLSLMLLGLYNDINRLIG
jgi:regulator of sigma E protease